MGDNIRERIAIEDPDSSEAGELLDKVIGRIEAGECPWGQIDFVHARVAGSEKAQVLVEKLTNDESLETEEIAWLVAHLES
jgi:hypothetical protein